jgi:hypothetical protein
MIDAIHQSSLNTALRCGEQFRRRYVENHVIPPGIAAGRGTGVHRANEVNLKYKIATGQDLDVSILKDAARDGFVNAFKNGIFLMHEDIGRKDAVLNDGLNDTIRLTELYASEVAPEIIPKEVERSFSLEVGLPLKIAGRIDLEQDARVDDLKTSGKKWTDDQIEKEIQPIFYSFVHEHETGVRPEFYYHILVSTKKAYRQTQSIKPTDGHYYALFAKLRMFCRMIETGTFLPANPSSWWCSKKWCGYWQTCPYVGNSLPKQWI